MDYNAHIYYHYYSFIQELSLPSKCEMVQTAEEDMAEWTKRFKNDALRVKGELRAKWSIFIHLYPCHQLYCQHLLILLLHPFRPGRLPDLL